MWHSEDVLEIHPQDAEDRGVAEGDWVGIQSRAGETVLRATLTDRVQPGVVYTTFHFPESGANVVTTDSSDWATNCPEYKVTAVQVTRVSQPSEWQRQWSRFADIQHKLLRERARERRGDDGEMMPSRRARTARRQRRHTLPAATIRTQSMSQPAEDRHDSIPAQVTRIRAGAIASATEADHLAEDPGRAGIQRHQPRHHAGHARRPGRLRIGLLAVRGIVDSAADVRGIDVVPQCDGIVVQLEISSACEARLKSRRRAMAGRTGCGLCGVETLPEVLRPVPPVAAGAPRAPGRAGRHARHAHAPAPARPDRRHPRRRLGRRRRHHRPGARGRGPAQRAGQAGRRAGAARPGRGIRHGAGVQPRQLRDGAEDRRRRRARAGRRIRPTALAVRLAQEANITLLGFLRNDDATLYAHPERILS